VLAGAGTLPQAPFFVKKCVFGPGTLPQAPFLLKKTRFWSWYVAAGAFFWWKNAFLVLERCRRRLFYVKKRVFGAGTLPQAPFFVTNYFLNR